MRYPSGEVVRVCPDGTETWFGLTDGGRLVAAAAAGPGVTLKSVLRSPVTG